MLVWSMRTLAIGVAFAVATSARAAPGDDVALKYPVVFTQQKLLAKFGLIIKGVGENDNTVKTSGNKCYRSAAGLYELSITNEFLKARQKRGFSLNSLCLGLISGIRFDPETGKRLPTLVLVDVKGLLDDDGKKRTIRQISSNTLTYEIPYRLPGCFKDGQPYADCKFAFDPNTGRKYSSEQRALYKKLGAKFIEEYQRQKADGAFNKRCGADKPLNGPERCVTEKDQQGWLKADDWCTAKPQCGDKLPEYLSTSGTDPGATKKWEFQTIVDVSPKFAKGFGYALYYPKGGGAPDPNADALESAQDGSRYVTDATLTRLRNDDSPGAGNE